MQRALHVNILLCAAASGPPLDSCVVYCSVMFVALDTHKRERVVMRGHGALLLLVLLEGLAVAGHLVAPLTANECPSCPSAP